MEEMKNPAPEEAQTPETTPAASAKKAEKKQQRQAQKAHYKQIRKELREKKREAYQAKTFLGKSFYVSRKVLSFLCALAVLFTVVRVNYKDVAFAALRTIQKLPDIMAETFTLSREDILSESPLDEERGALIDASAPLDEGETWAIYMYIVGSNLEASKVNQITNAAQYIADRDAVPLKEERSARNKEDLEGMLDTILNNGLDLPNSMYAKAVSLPVPEIEAFYDSIIDEFRTVMDDHHAASTDIGEITQVALPENVKVVLQPGGSVSWGSSMINPNMTQRFVYDSDGMHKVYESRLSNMGNPQTLADFLTFCEEEHPADHTMVILWNHGGAAFGYGSDSIYKDDLLTLEELRWAFEQVYTLDEENPPVDIIGFDACLMASMEVAESLHGVASYLVGSEQTEPGNGWDYVKLMTSLAENPRMNPLQLSRAVADTYMDYYTNYWISCGQACNEQFSVLDLSYADDLYQAYSDFASAALQTSTEYAGTAAYLGKAANSSIKFCGADQDVFNTMDLGLFMEGTRELFPRESEAVLKILDSMVLYNRKCSVFKEATGITVYYPAAVKDWYGFSYASQYINQICKDPDTKALYYYKVAGCLPEELQAYVAEQGYGQLLPMDARALKTLQKTNVTVRDDGNMTLPMTKEAVSITQDFNYCLLQVTEDGTARKLGNSSYLALSENYELQSIFTGQWLQMDGVLMQTEVVSGTPSSVRLRSHVMHNGTYSYLLLSVDLETQEWSILGIQPQSDTSDSTTMADRTTTQLKSGDTLLPIYDAYDIHTGVGTMITDDKITYKEGIEISEKDLPDGDYMSYISLVDARGDAYDMQVVSFQIKNGTMTNGALVKMP